MSQEKEAGFLACPVPARKPQANLQMRSIRNKMHPAKPGLCVSNLGNTMCLRLLSAVLVLCAACLIGFYAAPVLAADAPSFTLILKDHKFDPPELEVPKATKIKLVVKNLDPTPEEFESADLKREKVVAGNGEITLSVGPLTPGRYEYYGEFNEKTARGALVVKP